MIQVIVVQKYKIKKL